MIGIQLRYRYLNPQNDPPKFARCAWLLESEIRRDLNFDRLYYRGVKWFVTSDEEKMLQEFMNLYGKENKIVTSNLGKLGHILRDPEAYKR